MLSPAELADLRDKAYWEGLERSFRELRAKRAQAAPVLMDGETWLDWLTFMSGLTANPHRRPFRTAPGKMRL